jgi:cytochrome P450
LICNGTLAFIRHPKQWNLFKQDPAKLMKSATEECLRYDSPVKTLTRIASEDVEMRGGKVLKQHERIRWVMSAANRDPEKFPQPERFDINRYPNLHVAFGSGIHHCLGATLARLEGQEAFRALAERFDSLRLETEELEYQPSLTFRSLKSMPVTWN